MRCCHPLTILLCLALVAGEAVAEETESRPRRDHRHFGYSIGWTVAYYGQFRIRDVPELVRAIPLHEDDDFLADWPLATDPIIRADMDPNDLGTIGINVLASYRKWLEFGARLSYVAVGNHRVQQNQFGGTERGDPMSLRFYELESQMPVSLVLVAGIRVPIIPAKQQWRGLRLALGVEYDPVGTELRFTAGWDRFNEDEIWRRFDIGRLHHDGFYVRLDIAFGETGWAFLQANHAEIRFDFEEEFKDITIERDDTPILFGLRFVR